MDLDRSVGIVQRALEEFGEPRIQLVPPRLVFLEWNLTPKVLCECAVVLGREVNTFEGPGRLQDDFRIVTLEPNELLVDPLRLLGLRL